MKWKKIVVLSAVTFTCGAGMAWPRLLNSLEETLYSEKAGQEKKVSSYILLPDSENGLTEDIWNVKTSKNTSMHWKLLQLTKSKDRSVRHRAVKSIVDLPVLNTWQHKIIAQASDPKTSIGFARLPNSRDSFFLGSPFKNLSNENLKTDFFNVLVSLPLPENDVCLAILLKRLKKLAAKIGKNGSLHLEEPFVYNHFGWQWKDVVHFEKLCLEALLSHSSLKPSREVMLSKDILKFLYSVWRNHLDNIEYQSIIVQILANLAIEDSSPKSFHLTGWIGILASWSKSPHIEVSLPASKALANLDRDDFHHCSYDCDIYLLHPLVRQRKTKLDVDIIFIHGLLGATFWTWRQHDSMKSLQIEKSDTHSLSPSYTFCWPKDWLAQDFPNARVLSVDYSTCVTNWRTQCPSQEKDNLEGRAKSMIDKLLLSKVGDKPIIWIAHSMGGLVVKQVLVEAVKSNRAEVKSIADKTKGIIFMSVPHKGSNLASIFHSAPYIFQPSIDISQVLIGSPKLQSLHERFSDYVNENSINVLSFGETKKSKWGLTLSLLVSKESADPGFGAFYNLPVDHLSTCKPESKSDILYLKILEFLNKCTTID